MLPRHFVNVHKHEDDAHHDHNYMIRDFARKGSYWWSPAVERATHSVEQSACTFILLRLVIYSYHGRKPSFYHVSKTFISFSPLLLSVHSPSFLPAPSLPPTIKQSSPDDFLPSIQTDRRGLRLHSLGMHVVQLGNSQIQRG